jgi:hypothetical protein
MAFATLMMMTQRSRGYAGGTVPTSLSRDGRMVKQMTKEMRDVSRCLNDLMLSAAGKDETAYSYLEALWEEICKAENRYKCERCKH